MRNTLFLIAFFAAVGLPSAPARAQWSNYGNDDSIIRCESRDGRTERCATYGGDVQLVRQLSGSACIRGRTWGTDSRGVWVSSGCRAEFRVDTGYGYDDDDYGNNGYGNNYGNYGNSDGLFRCESRAGRTERCSSYGGRVQFIRQLSNTPCIRGQTWGSDSRGVWVSNGCRALFGANDRYGNGYGYGNNSGRYGNDLVRCESRDNRSHSCPLSAGRGGTIRLLRQLSGKPCIENQTWGRSRTGVWVTQGCRAEFVVGRGGSNGGYQRPPGDLGGVPGGKYLVDFQDASGGRQPGDLGDAVLGPNNEHPPVEDRQRPPAQGFTVRPPTIEANRGRVRPVEEAPGRVESSPVEVASGRIETRPVDSEAPGQVRPRDTGGAAEPGLEVTQMQPAPRERGMDQAEPR